MLIQTFSRRLLIRTRVQNFRLDKTSFPSEQRELRKMCNIDVDQGGEESGLA